MKEKNDRSAAGGIIVQSNRVIVDSLSTMNNSLPGMIKNLEPHPAKSKNLVWNSELSPH